MALSETAYGSEPLAFGPGGVVASMEGKEVIIGIDPGKTGAIAWETEHGVSVIDMPDTPAAIVHLLTSIGSGNVRLAIIEQQQAMPKQGLSSTFNYGRHVGILEAACIAAGYPIEWVTPSKWKRALGLNRDKTASRKRASEVFPDVSCAGEVAPGGPFARVKDDGRAEACLLVHYAQQAERRAAA